MDQATDARGANARAQCPTPYTPQWLRCDLGRLQPVLGPDDSRRPRSFDAASARASQTLCLMACQAATPPPRWSRPAATSLSPSWGYPDDVPNDYCGLAGCAISLPDPNRAAATASAG